jgi:hypothetical protein
VTRPCRMWPSTLPFSGQASPYPLLCIRRMTYSGQELRSPTETCQEMRSPQTFPNRNLSRDKVSPYLSQQKLVKRRGHPTGSQQKPVKRRGDPWPFPTETCKEMRSPQTFPNRNLSRDEVTPDLSMQKLVKGWGHPRPFPTETCKETRSPQTFPNKRQGYPWPFPPCLRSQFLHEPAEIILHAAMVDSLMGITVS